METQKHQLKIRNWGGLRNCDLIRYVPLWMWTFWLQWSYSLTRIQINILPSYKLQQNIDIGNENPIDLYPCILFLVELFIFQSNNVSRSFFLHSAMQSLSIFFCFKNFLDLVVLVWNDDSSNKLTDRIVKAISILSFCENFENFSAENPTIWNFISTFILICPDSNLSEPSASFPNLWPLYK